MCLADPMESELANPFWKTDVTFHSPQTNFFAFGLVFAFFSIIYLERFYPDISHPSLHPKKYFLHLTENTFFFSCTLDLFLQYNFTHENRGYE